MTSPWTAPDEVPSPPLVDVTLVIPFFNPGPTVRSTVERARHALQTTGRSFEIIAVSDGSTDGSAEALEGSFPDSLRTVALPSNRGKGYAVRTGFELGHGRYLGFIDADGDIAPELLAEFVETCFRTRADVCFGSKWHSEASVTYPLARRVYSRGYQRLVRALFHLPVPDTQTGLKLYRRELLDIVLPMAVEERFAFDLELFVLAQQKGFDQFVGLPVDVAKQKSSTVSFGSVWSVLRDTLAIFWRLRVRRGRGRPRRAEGRPGERREGVGSGHAAPDADLGDQVTN
jgi:glycosyltransferase involved in cell wall biosynthesis